MPTIERMTENVVKITFNGSATSNPFHCRGRYPISIYSPTGGPTSLELKKESPATAGSYVVANDASDAAITITLQANEWTVLSDAEVAAIMGYYPCVLVNSGSITLDLYMETGT